MEVRGGTRGRCFHLGRPSPSEAPNPIAMKADYFTAECLEPHYRALASLVHVDFVTVFVGSYLPARRTEIRLWTDGRGRCIGMRITDASLPFTNSQYPKEGIWCEAPELQVPFVIYAKQDWNKFSHNTREKMNYAFTLLPAASAIRSISYLFLLFHSSKK